MSYKTRTIGGADVQLDETTGALRTTEPEVAAALGGLGTTTDAPVADNTTVEGATARTGISLWKRAVNVLIALYGYFSANAKIADAELTATTVLAATATSGGFQSLGLVTNTGTTVGRFVAWSLSASAAAAGTLELGYGTAADGTGWASLVTINLPASGGEVFVNSNLLKKLCPPTVAKNKYMLLKASGTGLVVNGFLVTGISAA